MLPIRSTSGSQWFGMSSSIWSRAMMVLLALMALAGYTDGQPSKRLAGLRTPEQYLNMCLKGQNHKNIPSPEQQLHGECQPYQGRSCCTAQVANDVHKNETWYRLRREHCGDKKMSNACRKYFDKDLCFYECSPDLGPWLMQDSRRWREEKLQAVPLCRSDCERWFNSCLNDYTCVDNWYTGFQWKDGENNCPSECRTFQAVFGDAINFCQKIWDDSYRVVEDVRPCMRFPGVEGNRTTSNSEAARLRAQELLWQQKGTNDAGSPHHKAAAELTFVGLAAVLAFP